MTEGHAYEEGYDRCNPWKQFSSLRIDAVILQQLDSIGYDDEHESSREQTDGHGRNHDGDDGESHGRKELETVERNC